MNNHKEFLKKALNLATKSAKEGTGPFGCLIVKDGEIIAEGFNEVTKLFDPTAHAEVQAIRNACKKLKSHQLEGCTVYTSCYPCLQCFGAIYWARPDEVYYVNTADEAAQIGFDDAFIYEEVAKADEDRKFKFHKVDLENHLEAFDAWKNNSEKTLY